MSEIRKAVITAAGWGTRFLPITKAQPKEMLPLVDRPIIEYSVEEALQAGIEQVILVTAQNKQAIEDYFDRSPALEHFLEQRGQHELLKIVQQVGGRADVCYIRQKEPLGLGHAVLTARHIVGEEPFALFLPDDVFIGSPSVMQQMIDVYGERQGSVLAIERVSVEDTQRYGVISPEKLSDRTYQVKDLVEKPAPQEAPSQLAIMGRYILSPKIFDALERTTPGKNGEIQLTDGLRLLLREQPIFGYEYQGTRYDTGVPLGWLKATFSLALDHPEYGPALREHLRGLDIGD
ncbi:MAG: UTP--glucose-1-phosphate uridylyltransferase GalU [Chloroflexi bacterium]|nr:UTP--glucose-1-phosphate uridylyltransferase GalU [Chloroflexota bacterium]